MPNKAIQPGTKRQASALQDTSRRLQQQHQDTVVREARIRLDSKKAFMDDEFYLSETSGFGAERTMNGMEYMSPANLRAVLKSGNPLAQIHKNAKTGGMRSSSGMTARGPEQNYYQNQLAAAVQQQKQQQQYQQQQQQSQQQQQQHHHQQHNPYLNNTGFRGFNSQQDGYPADGVKNW